MTTRSAAKPKRRIRPAAKGRDAAAAFDRWLDRELRMLGQVMAEPAPDRLVAALQGHGKVTGKPG